MYPTDVRYTNDHEWVRKGGDGTVTVGITDWAARQLGEIVMIELQEAGTTLDTGDPFGTAESVKAVTELLAPVAGTVATVNAALSDSPETVNDDAYGEGWMITLKPASSTEYDGLMTAAQYEAFIKAGDD